MVIVGYLDKVYKTFMVLEPAIATSFVCNVQELPERVANVTGKPLDVTVSVFV